MSVYDCDYNLQADNINNPRFRLPNITTFLHIIAKKTIQWLHDIVFSDYLYGTSYSQYSGGAYVVGDRVTYGNGVLGIASYECYVANTGKLPTDSNYWLVISTDNIGLEERKTFNAQLLKLEYVLNRRFNPTGTTPPFGSTYNNIYIVNNPSYAQILYSSTQDNDGTYTAPSSSNTQFYCPLGNPPTGNFNFTIYVPSAILSGLANTQTQAKQLITSEVNKYNTVGITFNVQHY